MKLGFLLSIGLAVLRVVAPEYCVCTTVDCPIQGKNSLVMGDGNAHMSYIYDQHEEYLVVTSATGTLTPGSLDNGSETTSCTQKYSRMLEDDGLQDCDAGHILANRLGGYGNQPLNIFPQDPSTNRGIYAQMEGRIYDCMQEANEGYLSWEFIYANSTSTKPINVIYSAEFDTGCEPMKETFPN